MKTINIYIRYFSDYGGVERICFSFARYLQEKGVAFRVICGKKKITPPAGFEVIETGLAKPESTMKALSFFKRAGKIAGEHDGVNFSFEVIPNADIFRSGGGSHSVFMMKKMENLRGFRRKLKEIQMLLSPVNYIKPRLEQAMFNDKRLKKVIAISALTSKELSSSLHIREGLMEVIHNGINKKIYNIENRLKLAGERDKDKVVIGFAATNFALKGLTELVDALALLPDNYHLKVAGGDNPAKFIETAEKLGISSRLHFIGKASSMAEFYASLDVFCHPSYHDTFGNVVAEALAMGVPVAVSSKAGAAEVIDDFCGRVFDEVKPKPIADAILHCAKLGFGDYGSRVKDSSEVFDRYLELIKEIQ